MLQCCRFTFRADEEHLEHSRSCTQSAVVSPPAVNCSTQHHLDKDVVEKTCSTVAFLGLLWLYLVVSKVQMFLILLAFYS